MDVMQAHQAGFRDVVAQLGTALTEDNLRQLTRYTRRVILALDADAAGKAATMRGLDVARQALEPEWEPVFDPRGLIHLEGRLSVDIRVTTLPAGEDPDDLIRRDPASWATLVVDAVPLVEFYMDALLEGQDLADPKVKSDISEALLPVIRQVSGAVERTHYAQKLARILRVDERALLDMVTGPSRRRQRRPAREPSTEAPQVRKGLDLEAYCLRGLLQIEGLLGEVDSLLAEIGLQPLSASDFEDLENREVFRIWSEVAHGSGLPLQEELEAQLPAELHSRLEELLTSTQLTIRNRSWLMEAQVQPGRDAFDLKPDEATQDLLNSCVKLRERNLRKRNTEIRYLLEDADDTEARLYQTATIENIKALSRLQRFLVSGASNPHQASRGLSEAV
jgi:DNA primase